MLTKEEILELGGRVYFYDQVKNYGKWLHMENTEFYNNSVSCWENGVKKIYNLSALYSSDSEVNTFTVKTKGYKQLESRKDWSDSHYNFEYQITEEDIEKGYIKLDPYFVAKEWKIGSKDDSGALWHCFKTCARFGDKNTVEREIEALYRQTKRMAQLYNVKLED